MGNCKIIEGRFDGLLQEMEGIDAARKISLPGKDLVINVWMWPMKSF